MACENAKPGDADWDLSGGGIGDPTIQGYASEFSVNAGETVNFKIDTDAAAYDIDIYRLGYYGGAGARKVVANMLPSATLPQVQPACLRQAALGLVDCGNWLTSASWAVPTDAASGVYVARLHRPDTGGQSHIVFIVRQDAQQADLLFQTADTTWQAYNRYGGASTYCDLSGLAQSNAGSAYEASCSHRGVKVSYNRPFDTRVTSRASWLFGSEYPMIRFLESNGYNVKYWSGIDTDRRGAALIGAARPKVFLSVGHDEYWSGQQRTHVENARAAGVNLAFFSGNEVYWKHRWENSIDGTDTPHKTLVVYKETLNHAKIDPSPEWTGTWRDPRFSPPSDGGRPENALIGSIWTVNRGDGAIAVPEPFGKLRFWRHTAMETLLPGQVASTPHQTLGYEWGENLDNGFRPAGVVNLSSTTLNVPEKLLDFGSQVGPGVATHSLTLYRHNTRDAGGNIVASSLVFGASTIQWSWGLDTHHDGAAVPADRNMQQATVNLFADMGVQPMTLDATLTAAVASNDVVGPTSAVTSPLHGATVSSGAQVTISGTASDNSRVAGVEISVDGGATWKAASGRSNWTFQWVPGALGTATILSRAVDDSANLGPVSAPVTVTVAGGICPCTSLWDPQITTPAVIDAGDPNAVEVGVKFRSDIDGFITGIRYYKAITNVGTHVGNLWTSGGTNLGTVTFTNETQTGWQQANFATPIPITRNTTYVASYHSRNGHYSASSGYFGTSGVNSPPLHADPSSIAGGNGVFQYGPTGFPSNTFGNTNYWVDVVFAPSLVDEDPPSILDVTSELQDSQSVLVRWRTNEEATSIVEYSTDPSILIDLDTLPPGSATVSDSSFKTLHALPLINLSPNTTYYIRVSSVDPSGNKRTEAAPNITLPGPTLRDNVSADFLAGAGAATYVAETDGGEVILAPQVGTEFSGTALEPGWKMVPWGAGGNAIVDNGLLRVQGSRVGTCAGPTCDEIPTLSPGQSLRFVAQFSGDGFQHSGLAVTLEDRPWLIFSTKFGGSLYARSFNENNEVEETELGAALLGTPHLFQIDWTATGARFYVDGVLRATHSKAITGPMRPMAASDFNVNGGDILVDWMRLMPHAAAGEFVSRVFDAQSSVVWNGLQVAAVVPVGTTLALEVRAGETTDAQGVVGNWIPVPDPTRLPPGVAGRYLQYRALMTGSNGDTPELADIIISTDSAPVAVDDHVTAAEDVLSTFPASGPGSLLANDTDADNSALRVVAVTQPQHGVATLLPGGAVTYLPATGYNGPDSFTYVVSDGLFAATATVHITVTEINNPPTAVDNFYTTSEDLVLNTALQGLPSVLLNDNDQESDPLTASLVIGQGPFFGTINLNPNGSFVYVPNLNFAGADSFQYRAHDGKTFGNVATVTITILQVNDPPLGVSDVYAMVRNQTLAVSAPGVLRNDRDVEVEDTNPLKAIYIPGSGPLHGTFSFAQDGSFSYTPAGDYIGPDTFAYYPEDHLGARGMPVIVRINVNIKAVNSEVPDGGTLSTGQTATAEDPVQSGLKLPSNTAASVSISQGVVSGSSAPPSGYMFLNQQVTITALDSQGNEITAAFLDPLVVTFLLDGTLVPPSQNKDTLQLFRNGAVIPDCLGATTIPDTAHDPCVAARENGATLNGDVRFTILSTHASDWHVGVSTAATAPIAVEDGFMGHEGQALVVPGPGVLGNDITSGVLSAILVSADGLSGAGTLDLNSTGGFTFTPQPDFFGTASFTYKANDATNDSNEATVTLVIQPINRAPTFTAGTSQAVDEDSGAQTVPGWASNIRPGRDIEFGQALQFITSNDNPGLFSAQPTIAVDGTLSYHPAPNAFGAALVSVQLIDDGGTDFGGDNTSDTATFTITLNPINDAPSFTKGADQSLFEDTSAQSVANWATNISAGADNESGQMLTFQVSNTNPALFTVPPAVSPDGTLTYDPAPNANGTAQVTVVLRDDGGTANGGADQSAPQEFSITVKMINDAPTFTPGADPVVNEDAGPQAIAWATGISAGPSDESGQTLTFAIDANSNAGLFSAAPAISSTGMLTFTTAPDASGTATLQVRLTDDGGTVDGGADSSPAHILVITVNPVNDQPTFTKGADQSMFEDTGAQTIAGWATAISAGPADESGQTVSFLVSNDNPALFAAQPAVSADGTLTYDPATNAHGVATVTVRIMDNGGTDHGGIDTSAPQMFTITVSLLNDAPTFTPGANPTVNEDAGPQSMAWATNMSAGPADESGQALTFVVDSNSNAALFSAAPAVASDGTLTFTAAPNAFGTATVMVRLTDDGGTANGGADSSAAHALVITVAPINDAPTFVTGANQQVVVNSGNQTVANWATAIAAGPANESDQALTFSTSNDNPALFSQQPAVSPNGTLSFAAAPGTTGAATVSIALADNGGTANGGADTSTTRTFTIVVVPGTTTTTVASSNIDALFGTSVTFTATVTPAPMGSVQGGTVTFRRGTTTIGTGVINAAGQATVSSTTLPVGTHSVTAIYAGSASYLGSTSAAISQVISPSAKIQVNFTVHALQDNTKRPRVTLTPVEGAIVRVYRRWEPCTSTEYVSIRPKKWGIVFDGADGPNGPDPGCPVVTHGTYRAEGITDANGNVTIIVPPTTSHPNIDYLVIGRSDAFNITTTPGTDDYIYAAYLVPSISASQTKKAYLHMIRMFNGKRVPGKVLEEFGSYLAMVQPEEIEFTEDEVLYPVILVAEGAWEVTTSVATPSGFEPTEPTLSASVSDSVDAVQFTITDIGSEWTPTTVTHVIEHNGETRIQNLAVPMINNKRTRAKIDYATVDPGSANNVIDVLVNDNVAPPKTLLITGVTGGINGGTVTIAADGLSVLYTPPAADYVGNDRFSYTIRDSEGVESTGNVQVRVNDKPSIVIDDIAVLEGNQGSSTALFTVTLSKPVEGAISFDFATEDDTAVAGTDFAFASGTATFAPGQTTKTIAVEIIGNTTFQNNRKFYMKLWLDAANRSNARIMGGRGVAQIGDDDPKPTLQLATPEVAVIEGNSALTLAQITVTLTGDTALPASVNFTTANGSANGNSDYVPVSGTLVFEPGETTKTIEVAINGDTTVEATEVFQVRFNDKTAVTVPDASRAATVTIIDDDATSWVNTTVADFGNGTVDGGGYISRTNNGEIILKPALGTEFTGTALDAGWASTPIAEGGTTTVGSNRGTLDGAALVGGPAGYDAGRSMEFSAAFKGAAGQWGGFSGSGAASSPSAMIGTRVGNALVARTVFGATTLETPIGGNVFNGARTFRVEWNATNVVYWMNEKKVATHAVAVTEPMRPTLLDSAVDGVVLQVQYIRMTPYAPVGTYTSAVYDAGGVVNWQTATWAATTPAGTSVVVSYRTGNTPTPDATWTGFAPVDAATGALTGASRYFQFVVSATTSDGKLTPVVRDITLAFSR